MGALSKIIEQQIKNDSPGQYFDSHDDAWKDGANWMASHMAGLLEWVGQRYEDIEPLIGRPARWKRLGGKGGEMLTTPQLIDRYFQKHGNSGKPEPPKFHGYGRGALDPEH